MENPIITGFPIKFHKHLLLQGRAGGLWSRLKADRETYQVGGFRRMAETPLSFILVG